MDILWGITIVFKVTGFDINIIRKVMLNKGIHLFLKWQNITCYKEVIYGNLG